ncbi:DUF1850 domain-containing protein [Nesterenkonia salmonea]|uniref:DUF1850 domain-containing protein n=1 Tax=Nesterenkonia salmonea TaxID=1804987 RepID=A0A5R9BDQ2_9MICC|nr:DUF1850 domain-containing protein [Nesterenkonia salmonea]TLP98050.1 DUF1850 domain-containing protein [Nesterenkonia salmonea]
MDGSKPLAGSPWRRLISLGSAAATVAVGGTVGCADPDQGHQAVISHQRTDEVLAETPVTNGTVISQSWIHSIEQSPWTDTYRTVIEPDDDAHLLLESTEFSEYGAGMPLDEGDVSFDDGVIRIQNIDREFESLTWFHSHNADFEFTIDGEVTISADDLPDREPLQLRIETQ